ncbi:protein KRI1 homolog [Convolutriloba macropyga]|uniref:protein KRI1 homolog n=1 Tax=Convolutriloba macropyga TaxID=536237 RepID=UPI003F5261A8
MPSLFDNEDENNRSDNLDLFSSSSSRADVIDELKINTKFAKKYESYREKEEYQTLKDRLGDDAEDGDSSSSEEEVGPNAFNDSQFLRVLTALRQKDPSIYDKSVTFFDDNDSLDQSKTLSRKRKSEKEAKKPLLLDEYERQVLLRENGGNLSDDSDSELNHNKQDFQPKGKRSKQIDDANSKNFLLYNEEQRQLKEEISKAIKLEPASEGENEESSLLITKSKPIKKIPVEDSNEPLSKEASNLDERVKIFSDKEKYLLNFILDKTVESEDSGSENDDDDNDIIDQKSFDEGEDMESDTEFVDNQDLHEANYNFRFEVPGGCEIKSFPRNVSETLRQSDSATRSEKRRELKEKRDEIEKRRKEDLKRLKQLKKKEILDKIEKIRQSAGTELAGVGEEDLDSDFDPDKHDRLMAKTFDDEYYGNADDEIDNEKPQFSDMESDDNEGVDIDDENSSRTEPKSLDKLLKTAVAKPVFDPSVETFEQYLEKNYNIDFDDVIENEIQSKKSESGNETKKETSETKPGFKFKYRGTTSDSFGLSYEEILGAPDRELNMWVSLKKASQYREQRDELYDKRKFTKLASNKFKKAKVFSSLYKEPDQVPNAVNIPGSEGQSAMSLMMSDIKYVAEKRRRRKRKNIQENMSGKVDKKTTSYKKGKKKTIKGPSVPGLDMSDQRLKAFGIKNPTKFRHIQFHKQKTQPTKSKEEKAGPSSK